MVITNTYQSYIFKLIQLFKLCTKNYVFRTLGKLVNRGTFTYNLGTERLVGTG